MKCFGNRTNMGRRSRRTSDAIWGLATTSGQSTGQQIGTEGWSRTPAAAGPTHVLRDFWSGDGESADSGGAKSDGNGGRLILRRRRRGATNRQLRNRRIRRWCRFDSGNYRRLGAVAAPQLAVRRLGTADSIVFAARLRRCRLQPPLRGAISTSCERACLVQAITKPTPFQSEQSPTCRARSGRWLSYVAITMEAKHADRRR
jgi:hypothetical protein